MKASIKWLRKRARFDQRASAIRASSNALRGLIRSVADSVMLDCNVSFNYPVPITDDSIFYRNNSCYKRAKYSQPRQRRNHDDRQQREMPAFNERKPSYNSQYFSRPTCCCRLALVLLCVLFAQRGFILNTNLARLDSNFLSLNILTIGMLVGAAPTAHLDPTVRAERSANLSHITGASRKIQMYIKNRHLQILPDGTVNGSTDDTSDYSESSFMLIYNYLFIYLIIYF